MPVLTSNAVANAALQLAGDNQTSITGGYPNFDSSAAGQAMAALYPWAVRTVARVHLKLWLADKSTGRWVQAGLIPGSTGRYWLTLEHAKVGDAWVLTNQTAIEAPC